MSRKIIGIGATIIVVVMMMMGISSIISKIWDRINLPYEFKSSTAAYHVVYGDNPERLEILDEKAQEMGYKNFNDYRVRTW